MASGVGRPPRKRKLPGCAVLVVCRPVDIFSSPRPVPPGCAGRRFLFKSKGGAPGKLAVTRDSTSASVGGAEKVLEPDGDVGWTMV